MADRPWAAAPDGLTLAVRLTPRAGRDRIDGIVAVDGRPVLAARVAAAPVEGAANRALLRLVAAALGVAKSAVTLEAGATARVKRLRVEGDPIALAGRLAAATGATPERRPVA